MRGLLIALVVLTATADAAPLRLKIRPTSGDFIATDKPCDKEARLVLWTRVAKAFFVEVYEPDNSTGGTPRFRPVKGAMLVSDTNGLRAADRFVVADPFIGFFDIGTTTTFLISVRDRFHPRRFVPVEIALIVRSGNDACTVKWLGSGERI